MRKLRKIMPFKTRWHSALKPFCSAHAEFNAMVNGLRQAGVDVVIFDYPLDQGETPDAVFPNNWFSTTEAGELFLFPMACANRRLEVRPKP